MRACFGGNLNVVQFLLQQGFDMYIGDNDRYTGFHIASFTGYLNVEQGFDMNFCNDNGGTAFHAACFGGNLHVVQFLLQQGLKDINKLCGLSNDVSCLHLLIDDRHDYADNELFMSSILLLIEAGAEFNKNHVFEELIPAIQNRIIEIMFVTQTIFDK